MYISLNPSFTFLAALSKSDQQSINPSELYQDVYKVVKLIPEGKVATYGQVAALIGRPRHARHVGYALSALPENHSVPWHRVINSQGKISQRADPSYADYQRLLLEEEGVEFGLKQRVSLKAFQWQVD